MRSKFLLFASLFLMLAPVWSVRAQSSDDLGDCWMTYMDNTITASTNGNTFQLKSIGNEYFAITYVPIDIRNEYQIQQFLLGRKNR